MPTVTADLICAQALELRGATLEERRAQQIAADVERLNQAAQAARGRLDFNDEPARFAALLQASALVAGKRK